MKNINTQETLTDYDQQKGSKDGARGQKKTTNIAPKASFRKNSLIKMIIIMKIERKQKVNNMNRVTTIYVPLILIYNESIYEWNYFHWYCVCADDIRTGGR